MANSLRSINLSTRVLLVVLALFVASIWGLAARVAAVLQTDLEKVVSAHLSATVGYVAADIDAKLQLRINLLNEIAASVTPDILADPAKVQRLLSQRHTSQALFPSGITITNIEGIAIAEYPRMAGRLGGSLRDRDYFQQILAGAKQAIGRPMLGRFSKHPIVAIAVPLHDASGSVACVLVGPVFPSDPNLFGRLEDTKIGKASYFTVFSPKDGVIVSASDKSKILQPVPAKGVNPLFDRRVEGFEGVGRTINSSGVDVLTASRNMRTTGWIVLSAIPTEEAFAPIASIKRQIYLTALALSLLAMAVLYFVLQRQLAPLQEATTAMRRMTEGTTTFAPLPGGGKDEIGRLVQSFNQLVAERGRLEDTLRHREQHARALFDAMPIAIGHVDTAQRITFANRLYRTMYTDGTDPVGRTIRDVLGEQIYAFVEPFVQRTLAGEETQFDRSFAGDDGLLHARWVRYVPDRDAAGEVIGFFSLIQDITERIAAEARQRLAASVFDDAAEAIMITDRNNDILSVNRAFSEITGYSEEEVTGKNSRLLRSGLQDPSFYQEMWDSIREKGRWSGEIWNRRGNGDAYCAYLSISTVRDENGEIANHCSMFTDITERKNVEAALLRLNAELEQRVVERTQTLEQANREMQSFSYSISHDLRAPLRAIDGFSKIVLARSAGKFDQETIDNLGRIAAAAERMGRLIDDLLKLSQVSRTELRRQAVNLSQIAGEVARNLAQVPPERQVEVLIAPDMMVDADQGLIQIVLENLIGNAWKFTSRTDGAKIEVGQQERDGEMICFVRDNGAGFDMRYAGKLFGAFQRLHTQREFEGTGIGLSIVQRIVVKHGGRTWAEAKPGAGATLYFTLAQGTRAV